MGACGHIWKSIIYSEWKGTTKETNWMYSRNREEEEEEKKLFIILFCFFLCVFQSKWKLPSSNFPGLAYMTQNWQRGEKIARNWWAIANETKKKTINSTNVNINIVSADCCGGSRLRERERNRENKTVAVYKNSLKLIKFNSFLSLHYLDLICFLHRIVACICTEKNWNHFLQRFSIKVAAKVH